MPVKESTNGNEEPPPIGPGKQSDAQLGAGPSGHNSETSGTIADECSPSSSERTAADVQAAYDLLYLARSVPAAPPRPMLPNLHVREGTLVPVYKYAIQPTNLYVLAEALPPPPQVVYAIDASAILQQEYTTVAVPIGNNVYQQFINSNEVIVPVQQLPLAEVVRSEPRSPQFE